MKILLLGKNGQVGWELQRALQPLGEVIALGRTGHENLYGDLSNLDELRRTVLSLQPDVIVNAAAYTNVDKAQCEPDLAERINSEAPKMLAKIMEQLGGWLVHFSSDYVFDGSGSHPRKEGQATGPLNVYGESKLKGEIAIQQSGCKHLIFRTSWVYAARGENFAKTMLRLASERKQIKVIDDQIGAPTGAELIADITAHCLLHASKNPQVSGLYHLAANGAVSWHGYASFVIKQARLAGNYLMVERIDVIPTLQYPTPAKRPLNSRLDCSKLHTIFGLYIPQWQIGVGRMLNTIQGHANES